MKQIPRPQPKSAEEIAEYINTLPLSIDGQLFPSKSPRPDHTKFKAGGVEELAPYRPDNLALAHILFSAEWGLDAFNKEAATYAAPNFRELWQHAESDVFWHDILSLLNEVFEYRALRSEIASNPKLAEMVKDQLLLRELAASVSAVHKLEHELEIATTKMDDLLRTNGQGDLVPDVTKPNRRKSAK